MRRRQGRLRKLTREDRAKRNKKRERKKNHAARVWAKRHIQERVDK